MSYEEPHETTQDKIKETNDQATQATFDSVEVESNANCNNSQKEEVFDHLVSVIGQFPALAKKHGDTAHGTKYRDTQKILVDLRQYAQNHQARLLLIQQNEQMSSYLLLLNR